MVLHFWSPIGIILIRPLLALQTETQCRIYGTDLVQMLSSSVVSSLYNLYDFKRREEQKKQNLILHIFSMRLWVCATKLPILPFHACHLDTPPPLIPPTRARGPRGKCAMGPAYSSLPHVCNHYIFAARTTCKKTYVINWFSIMWYWTTALLYSNSLVR